MNQQLFTQSQGYLIILGYALLMFFLTWLFSRGYNSTKDQFLLAKRSLGKWESAFSIAATWIWAPALFVSAEKAYTQGIVGLFWFLIPNILCLIIFSYFALKIREQMPEGFTLSDFIRTRHSNRVQTMYLIELIGLAICSFAVQLLAGGKVISVLTGIPFYMVSLLLALIPIIYSLFSGLKASVITDYAQMLIILIIGGFIAIWAINNSGGINVIFSGLGGKTGQFTNLFDTNGLNVFYSFGLAATIGLISGPFGDQSFWQRAFATKKEFVKSSFIYGAFIFAIVPIIMSLFGFIAAGKGINIKDTALVNLEVVINLLPIWVIVPFVYMLMSGLVSTLDSNLCAISSMSGHDILNRIKNKDSNDDKTIVNVSRWSMIILATLAWAIANIPDIKILYLFLFYGALRSSVLLPTIIALLTKKDYEKGSFWGILFAICIGLPIFAYGNFNKIIHISIIGSLITVLIPLVFIGVFELLKKEKST